MTRPTGRPRSCTCGKCQKCKRAAYMREWWAKWTPEQKREKTARRNPDRVREQDRLKQAKRRREGTPEQKLRIAARAAVRNALTRGDLTRENCEVEGCEAVGHAHHEDYSKPLEVRWLCRQHHDELHSESNNLAGPSRIDDLGFTSGSKERSEMVDSVSHSPVTF